MPRPAYRKLYAARRRNRRMGEAAQCRTRPHQLDVHDRKGSRQNRARLSETYGCFRPTPKSQNLCDEVLGAALFLFTWEIRLQALCNPIGDRRLADLGEY